MSYTKGEWKVKRDISCISEINIENDYFTICRNVFPEDAHLISAAPNMYKALKKISNCTNQDDVDRLIAVGLLDELKNIINKAEGK